MGRIQTLDHKAILADYINGLRISEICERNHCSEPSVSRIARENNVLRHRDNTKTR